MPLETGFDAETTAFLESGCALIVGLVAEDGEPVAARAWGLRVLGDGRLRLMVGADEAVVLDALGEGRPLAVTATSVPTFRSVQVKGRIDAVELPGHEDAAVIEAHLRAFGADVEATDGIPAAQVLRMRALEHLAVVVDPSSSFDQTPGPAAGVALR